jgi:hypothetical protein
MIIKFLADASENEMTIKPSNPSVKSTAKIIFWIKKEITIEKKDGAYWQPKLWQNQPF